MIVAKDLSFSVLDKVILHETGISFGDTGVVGIIGQNGAGKSTLAKAMCNLLDFSGEILINDKSLRDISGFERASLVSYCGEMTSDIDLSAGEVIEYARVDGSENSDLLSKIYEIFDIEKIKKQKISTLSGGERQRINLAASFYQESAAIILDEPTNFLDPLHIDMLEKAIVLFSKNHLVIVISHNINFISNIAGSIIGLKNGEVIFNDEVSKLLSEGYLDKIFEREFKYFCNEDGVFIK
ncbi:ABC transporter ATP-binding protein [Bacteriovorax sp. Seq25_V]|uniref:ABC transporter ATP-binding protein n=1 Tax=Bacteriovorax sp. Seq25_V TaxID=1201288 RepID=UPI00038A3358|nr:ABC transporter ATP-binding protein [Bacteriovorax sp. Seq25_V]EQC44686.1 ABC transporter, ATP-binding protein [Bacteriovorax sp. Seq25_V]